MCNIGKLIIVKFKSKIWVHYFFNGFCRKIKFFVSFENVRYCNKKNWQKLKISSYTITNINNVVV